MKGDKETNRSPPVNVSTGNFPIDSSELIKEFRYIRQISNLERQIGMLFLAP